MTANCCAGSAVMEAGFGEALITPRRGIPLAGYFTGRPNRGALDPLHVRACLFRCGTAVAGVLQYDLLEINTALYAAVQDALCAAGFSFGERLIIGATHTHAGPDLWQPSEDSEASASAAMFARLVRQGVEAVRCAAANLGPATIHAGRVANNPFAFNRRYWMKNGGVVTNPGKLNPDIERPEGPVDREIGILKIVRDGAVAGLLVNVVNHTDTIGGYLVSADWPGFLARRLQKRFGRHVPVLTLVGTSGNINHFDVASEQSQTCYQEARRIGTGYADIIWRELADLPVLARVGLAAGTTRFALQKRQVTEADLDNARVLLNTDADDDAVLTSEDLARGAPAVLRYFAAELVAFAETAAGTVAELPLTALVFGRELALVSLPGEPFVEIGQAIKRQSPCALTFVVSNANGSAGYLPLRACYEHGGYEPLPTRGGGAAAGMAEALSAAAVNHLLATQEASRSA